MQKGSPGEVYLSPPERAVKAAPGRSHAKGFAMAEAGNKIIPQQSRSPVFTRPPQPARSPVFTNPAKSEPDGIRKLREKYEELQIKQNFKNYAAFTILQPYLPAGTRFTSGFRSREEQVKVIENLARNYNANSPPDPIALPDVPLTLADRESWDSVLGELRARGYIVSSPLSTPHAGDEVVFDMSGPNLESIVKGCENAQRDEWVIFAQVLKEKENNAVHVQIASIGGKALQLLGGGALQTGPVQQLPLSQLRTLQELRSQHDSTADLYKKIDYDRQRIRILNLITQSNLSESQSVESQIQQLEAEIEQHRQEVEQRAKDARKTIAFDELNRAVTDGRLQNAEQLAEQINRDFPSDSEARGLVEGIKARRGLNDALNIFINRDCGESANAVKFIANAARFGDSNPNINRIKQEVELWASRCNTGGFAIYILSGLIGLGLLAGIYVLARPGKWALKCIDGPCKGEVFPLDKPEVSVGAFAEADIVINDPRRRISRTHLVIRQEGRNYYLKDESANGTRVNGRLIPRDTPLKLRNKDEIVLADAATIIFQRA